MAQEKVKLLSGDGTALVQEVYLPEGLDSKFPDMEPPLLSWNGRLFRFIKGTFSFGGSTDAEYLEVTPVFVSEVPGATKG